MLSSEPMQCVLSSAKCTNLLSMKDLDCSDHPTSALPPIKHARGSGTLLFLGKIITPLNSIVCVFDRVGSLNYFGKDRMRVRCDQCLILPLPFPFENPR